MRLKAFLYLAVFITISCNQNVQEVNTEIKVYVTKDIMADEDKYLSLLEEIGSALLKIRDMQSVRLYGKLYDSLEETEKREMEKRVPYQVYGSVPKVM